MEKIDPNALTRDELLEMGCGEWDPSLILLTPELAERCVERFVGGTIMSEERKEVEIVLSERNLLDTRDGCLSFGVYK